MNSKLTLAILAKRSGGPRHQQAGFALLLSLFVGLAVVIGWLMLAARTSSSRLGAALQSENREARLIAESGVDAVISQLNQPRNRLLLARGTSLGEWRDSERYRNLCNNASGQPPSATIAQLGSGTYFDLPAMAANDRFTRRYRLKQVTLKDKDRNPREVGSRSPINLAQRRAVGYIELEIEGQLLRNGAPAATAFIKREYQVVPKCCERSFRGLENSYGNDNRSCPPLPQFLVGTSNSDSRNSSGIKLNTTIPNIRSRENPLERPDQILCYSESTCEGVQDVDRVPIISTNQSIPKVPVLGPEGVPCDEDDSVCIEAGINKARSGGFTARPLDLITQDDKDYIRVNNSGQVEICNKDISTSGENASTLSLYDRTPSIKLSDGKPDCELMMGNGDSSKNVCAEQNINGFKSYHCRIRNIFVNDTGATNDNNVRQNNTLFIDSSNGPIYLYVNEDWAATERSQASDAVNLRLARMTTASFTPPAYQAIYTVGNFNDGQIQHVYCGSRNGQKPKTGSEACTEKAPSEITSRTAIVSACRRKFNQELKRAEEDCSQTVDDDPKNNINKVNAVIGDDGFVRDLFFFMPNSKLTIEGDPFGDDDAQGKPQVAAALWVNDLEFTNDPELKERKTEIYVPGPNAEFFGLQTSLEDPYTPRIRFDYIARNITNSLLFFRP